MMLVSRALSSGTVTTYSDCEKAGLPSRRMRMVTTTSLDCVGTPWSEARTVSCNTHLSVSYNSDLSVSYNTDLSVSYNTNLSVSYN